ncbi:sphingomyelin phosphodiesterase [Artomyces pyxidatus]|uniref:Sphingomyelin phosphodiesterase n=1 Tax=Artomyces pyxidatus TaxID=48021 RepID=A0ACB8T1G5_9AGAM|nr:sphingomyelin phosphodiesterase [Artomyces pyxidatus]
MLSLRYSILFFLVTANCSLLSDILSAFETSTDCTSCHATLLPALQTGAQQGDTVFVSTLTTVCQTLKLADDDVCVGEFERVGPILAHSLRALDTTGPTATQLCDAAFGLCQPLPVNPFTVTFPEPAPAQPKKFVSRGRPPIKVVHFSDVHIDRQYTVGADANCTKNICCRDFADHMGPVTEPAGPFGNPACDTPVNLAESMLSAIAGGGFGEPQFAIFTGDVVSGDTWIVDKSEAAKDLVDWNAAMLSGLQIPVYPTLGHDSAPVNSFPRNTTRTNETSQWVFDIEQVGWEPWIGRSGAEQQDHTSGSYATVVPGTNLRIVSINTQYWYKEKPFSCLRDSRDPNGILSFVVDQLQSAEDLGQRAWLVGHIPPGKADIIHDQSNYYNQIVQRYINTVAAQFFGHSHKDQFEIAYSDFSNQTASSADSIVFIGPALTPTSGNPAFKIYDVDPDTFEVMDAKVFITNISDPHFQVEPCPATWKLYYSARDSYGPLVGPLAPTDPLNASFWHQLTDVFEANDTAFQLFNTRISRGGAVSACNGDCKTTTICDMRAARAENNCDFITPGTQLKREVRTERSVHGGCESGGISTLLRGAIPRR